MYEKFIHFSHFNFSHYIGLTRFPAVATLSVLGIIVALEPIRKVSDARWKVTLDLYISEYPFRLFIL